MSQFPPLELRRQQEEVKLYHKCIRGSIKFPEHNLTQAYQLWKQEHEFKHDEKFVWSEKLSTLSRAHISANKIGMPEVVPDHHPFYNKPPMHVERLPHSTKSRFKRWSEPTPDQILESLDSNTIVIFADGSTKPEPGIGGSGLVIQDPSLEQWIEMESPIKGITTTIGSEIDAIRHAIEYVCMNYKSRDERIIILSDCKFVVNAIHNKCNSENYNLPIADCQIFA